MSTATPAPRTFVDPTMLVDDACAAALQASARLALLAPARRADLLDAIAAALDAAGPDLVPIAMAESRLTQVRLTGEVGRASGQLRLMANVIRQGAYLGVTIDEADANLTPPRPDLRRMMIPLGPVAVFAASNFPFAFSVLGNDTAAALAAGCPVVAKPNPGHPRLSQAVIAVAQGALAQANAPKGMLTLIDSSLQAGIDLVRDDRIEAVGFTGSQRGGLALAKIAADRPRPIPFFGELGSINPIVVTAEALVARRSSIVEGFIGSFTLGAGQFCTKPGLLIAPVDSELREALRTGLAQAPDQAMLTDNIRDAFHHGLSLVADTAVVTPIHVGHHVPETNTVTPSLYAVSATDIVQHPHLLDECFGPTALLVEYAGEDDLRVLLEALPGVLAAGVQAQGDESMLPVVLSELTARAGRVIFNEWPTGVAVTWAMQHGGPFPAATRPESTSVGAYAIDRFMRAVTWQSIPDALLPQPLQHANPLQVPRRVNGVQH
ncbi:MAG: aldehyde dehydrogenase family protein [Candidatus Nanopelagicales bacterium]|jgi:NADP-dependent aldehyde dehydrogenase|nr:aldehyde dehydrogenase family protein [Candidatus Nanopelagicales bacterium]